jgi:hypothetical protein
MLDHLAIYWNYIHYTEKEESKCISWWLRFRHRWFVVNKVIKSLRKYDRAFVNFLRLSMFQINKFPIVLNLSDKLGEFCMIYDFHFADKNILLIFIFTHFEKIMFSAKVFKSILSYNHSLSFSSCWRKKKFEFCIVQCLDLVIDFESCSIYFYHQMSCPRGHPRGLNRHCHPPGRGGNSELYQR